MIHFLPVLISLPLSCHVRPALHARASIQVPGEFGNDTLCTDPAWHTALAALTWLGLPYQVEHQEVKPRSMRARIYVVHETVLFVCVCLFVCLSVYLLC